MKLSRTLFIILCLCSGIAYAEVNVSHAIAMHDTPKYESHFKHFDYTNPNAIKGGSLRLAVQGNFDSLNSFIAKGNAAEFLGLTYDSLTTQSADEAFTQYGLVAEKITWPDDRTWVEYSLHKSAKFSDNQPITAEDVKFSFDILMSKGSPAYKTFYAGVKEVKVLGKHNVRFEFVNGDNKELALIVGQIPVLPKHFWQDRDFSESSLEIPLGSGPYIINSVDAGKSVTFERNHDYWAKDHPVNHGRYNFDQVTVDYYRDSTVLLEALKANEYDIRRENVSKLWATGYTGPAIESGRIKTELIKHSNPTGMQAFVLNQRNKLFQDLRVRKALNYAFDFEWTNKNLFYDAYKRSSSFFSNSELASSGLPSQEELKLLNPLKEQLPKTVFTEPFSLPVTDGSGNNRNQLRKAKQLLEQAGWKVVDNKLTNQDGEIFQFEFLVYDPAFERIINPFARALKRLGISTSIRKVEVSQYINRMRSFNFDVMVATFSQSLSPGTEQIQYWHSSTADMPSSRNLIGLKDNAIDQLVDSVVNAKSRSELVTATRALDRALLHNWLVIPQWYIDAHRVAYWDKFEKPEVSPKYDTSFTETLFTWWIKPSSQN